MSRVVNILVKDSYKVEIVREKKGDDKVFFYPTFNKKRISPTLFFIKYEAECFGRRFLKSIGPTVFYGTHGDLVYF